MVFINNCIPPRVDLIALRLPEDGLLSVVPFTCALSNFSFQVLYVLECNELAKHILNHFFQVLVVWMEV